MVLKVLHDGRQLLHQQPQPLLLARYVLGHPGLRSTPRHKPASDQSLRMQSACQKNVSSLSPEPGHAPCSRLREGLKKNEEQRLAASSGNCRGAHVSDTAHLQRGACVGAHQVGDACVDTIDGTALGHGAQQPHPGLHLSLVGRCQQERIKSLLRPHPSAASRPIHPLRRACAA